MTAAYPSSFAGALHGLCRRTERIDTITVERFNCDINEQQITGSIVPDMLSPRTLMMRIFSASCHRTCDEHRQTSTQPSVEFYKLTVDYTRPGTDFYIKNVILKYFEWLTAGFPDC